MAHPINDIINKREGRIARLCDEGCKYFAFYHSRKACILSSVFSVSQGDDCFEYEERHTQITQGGEGGKKAEKSIG